MIEVTIARRFGRFRERFAGDSLRRAFVFFDFAVANADHAVGVRGDVRLVRDEDDGVAASRAGARTAP